MYQEGVFITEISRRTGFGTSTIFRWATEAGILKPFSMRLAEGASGRQFGQEVIGRKGAFHTSKGGAWIHTDSTYEYARLDQLEAIQQVIRLDRCRDRIEYFFGGRKRTYIPDFRIELADGSVVVEEIKPKRWVIDPKVRAKVDAAVAFYDGTNVIFRVITEDDIGIDRIRDASATLVSRYNEEHMEEVRERRRAQRAVNQRAYTERKKMIASPDEIQAMRNRHAAFQRKYRARRKNISA